MFQRRTLRTIAASVTIAAALQAAPVQASAATTDNPFKCDGTPYIMQDGDLYAIDQDPADPNLFLFRPVNQNTRFGNSLAYDPATDLIYGIRSQKVETYDAAGTILSSIALQSPWPGGSSYAATTLGDGSYVIVQYNREYNGSKNNLWSVDPTDGAVTYIGPMATRHADLSFNPADGYMYHVTGGRLYKIDPRDASEVQLPLESGMGSHGSSWFDAAGNLYVHHNSTGNLYQVTEIGSDMAKWRLVGNGDPVSGADGANCIGGLALEQTSYGSDGEVLGNGSTVEPGDTVTQIFTVYNNELPAETSTLTICDSLSGGSSTYSGAFGTSNNSGKLVSGGEAGSTEFCYAVDAPSSLWSNPDKGAEEPVQIKLEIVVGETPGSSTSGQGWIETDGNPETKDVQADNTGTGTKDDETTIVVASPEPEPTEETTTEETPAEEPTEETTTEEETTTGTETTTEETKPTEETTTEESYAVTDAGLGTGAACPVYADEKMLPRVEVADVVVVKEATSLLATGFDNLNGISILSGVWDVDNGKLNQLNDCGSDYTALLNTKPVEHFRIDAKYASIDTGNNAGITFGVSGPDTRSGAMLVDLADDGKTLRWGYYDDAGFYQYIGSAEVDAATTGQEVKLSVEVHGQKAIINFNGEEITSFETKNARGYVGLVSSRSTVAYDEVNLTALPAA